MAVNVYKKPRARVTDKGRKHEERNEIIRDFHDLQVEIAAQLRNWGFTERVIQQFCEQANAAMIGELAAKGHFRGLGDIAYQIGSSPEMYGYVIGGPSGGEEEASGRSEVAGSRPG